MTPTARDGDDGRARATRVSAARLRARLERAPSDHELRLQLAELLARSGDPAGALRECARVLEARPDDVGALKLAEQAAGAAGDAEAARRYRRIWTALADADMIAEGEHAEPSGSEVVELRAVRGGRAKTSDDSDLESPDVTLADVGGLEQVKQRLRASFLAPMANPELRRAYAKSLRGGLLLWGPPGCGKTFIARAAAGELGARFLAIALHDVLDMWLGESERKLHELFETARSNAPCVVFVDEVDALGRRRTHLTHGHGLREVVVQFLAELDGFHRRDDSVFVLAATNHPWDVDTALRRPGRLDRMLLVLPPDEPAREAILGYHLRERPARSVDVRAIARRTDLYSGADLALVCETAAEYAFEDSVASGEVREIDTEDLERALKEISPSTVPWLLTAKNYAEYGGERRTYDDLLAYVRERGLA